LRLARNNSVEAVVVNVFCSITRCDDVAQGILAACKELSFDVPIVVRLDGTNHQEGSAVLTSASSAKLCPHIRIATSLDDAVEQVVELVRKERAA
jgi:succinyl-CoA synthetase beta subunit